MLNGTGGDEMNAQALDPLIPLADLLARFRFREFAKQLVAWSLVTRRPFIQLLFASMLEVLPLRLRARLTERGKVQPWVSPQLAKKYAISARQLEDVKGVWFWRPGPRDAMQTITTMSRDLTYAAPSSLEQRYPYLDQQLVEFLTTIPFDQLIRPGERRFLMRRALSRLLPLEVLQRKTKVSNARCYPITVEKHWQRIEEALISPLSSQLGYLDGNGLRLDLLTLKHGQIPNHLVRLLKALSLEFWLRDAEARKIVAIRPTLSAVAGAQMLQARAK
jgi:asparagine synthase (glutamine-hydrolysing)